MVQQIYRTRSKLNASKKFVAGHGAVKFVVSANPQWTHMIVFRPLVASGELIEVGSEAIPTNMVADLVKRMKPYAVA